MTSETRMVEGISGIGAVCSAAVSRGGEPPKPPAHPARASAEITTVATGGNRPRHLLAQQTMTRAPCPSPARREDTAAASWIIQPSGRSRPQLIASGYSGILPFALARNPL